MVTGVSKIILFDRNIVNTVMQKWYRIMSDLPNGIIKGC
jgi:hypothetical protein